MADITKCTASTCPSRMKCLRWTAPTSPRQSRAMFRMRRGDEICDDFIPNGAADLVKSTFGL